MNKKNNRQKKNAGFSLVELIVVVLIMAVIAVVLAPQIMKWVENSRLSTDKQNLNQLVSNVQLALAKESALKEVVASNDAKTVTVTANEDTGAPVVTIGGMTGSIFKTELDEITGTYPTPKSSTVKTFKITITIDNNKVKNVVGEALNASGGVEKLDIE